MQVTIEYEFDSDYPDNPCWAKATYSGKRHVYCGKTFEEAKARLLSKLEVVAVAITIPVPQSETIDLPENVIDITTQGVPHVN